MKRSSLPPLSCRKEFTMKRPAPFWSLLALLILSVAASAAPGDTIHNQSLGSRPIRVLTTGNHAVHFLPAPNAHDPKHLEYEHQIELAQARLLALSSNARQVFVPNSSEYAQFNNPDSVVEAIRDVYTQSK